MLVFHVLKKEMANAQEQISRVRIRWIGRLETHVKSLQHLFQTWIEDMQNYLRVDITVGLYDLLRCAYYLGFFFPHEASCANYKNKDFVVSFPEDEA